MEFFTIAVNKTKNKVRKITINFKNLFDMNQRFDSFDEDIKHWNDYDYILINKNLDVCFKQIENIILNYKTESSTFSQKTL